MTAVSVQQAKATHRPAEFSSLLHVSASIEQLHHNLRIAITSHQLCGWTPL